MYYIKRRKIEREILLFNIFTYKIIGILIDQKKKKEDIKINKSLKQKKKFFFFYIHTVG